MKRLTKAGISLLLVLTMLMNVCAVSAMADEAIGSNGLYVYIGDSMTFDFVGSHNKFLDSTDIYPWQVARAMDYTTDDYGKLPGGRATDAYAAISDYPGDDYSKKTLQSYVSGERAERFKQAVVEAKAVSVQIGYSELTTFLLDNLLEYFRTGKLKYSCDLNQIFSQAELNEIRAFVSEGLDSVGKLIPEDTKTALSEYLAELPEEQRDAMISIAGQSAFDVLSGVKGAIGTIKDVFVYTMASAIVHYDALIEEILLLNPDVELYVMGLTNPITHLRVGFSNNGSDYSVSIGELLGGFFDLMNSYYRIFSPHSNRYYFVNNVHHAEVYSESMAHDMDLTRRILYAHYHGNRDGYEVQANAAAYEKADQQAPGVMQMLNNTRMIDLGRLITDLSAGKVSFDTSDRAFEKLAHYDESGNTTASYSEQIGALIALCGMLKGIAVHPTQAGHDEEAKLLIDAMRRKQRDPLAAIFHQIKPSLEMVAQVISDSENIDDFIEKLDTSKFPYVIGGIAVGGAVMGTTALIANYTIRSICEATSRSAVSAVNEIGEGINTVSDVQQWLNDNYDAGLTVDGGYGNMTKQAIVKALQKELGFTGADVDGVAGQKTLNALPELNSDSQGNTVVLLQCLLLGGGYGNDVEQAVLALQNAQGMAQTGVCDSEVWKILLG